MSAQQCFWHVNIVLLNDRRYAWDWLAVLLLMVVLVITEKLKPFEKSIYHEDNSVSLDQPKHAATPHIKTAVPSRLCIMDALVTGGAARSDQPYPHALVPINAPNSTHNCAYLWYASGQDIGPICFSPAGDLAIQLPLAHQEHSAGMGRPHFVHLWSSKRLCCVVPDMEAQQMGDAQPHSGTDGQRVCMRPHH